MISTEKLVKLIELAEVSQNEPSPNNGNSSKKIIDISLAQKSIDYLLEPYENGFWEIRANWNSSSPFAKHILRDLGTFNDFENEEELQNSSAETILQEMSEEKRFELIVITNRLSTLNHIFLRIIQKKHGRKAKKLHPSFVWISDIDNDAICENFASTIKIFEEKIYFEGMSAGVASDQGFQIKSGLVYFLEAPRKNNQIHAVAPCKQALQDLAEYYSSLEVISPPTIQRVFAPDEALFKPYFTILSSVFSHVVRDVQINGSFSEALEYYKVNDFQHCISTLGIITEGYLHRIYSSLLREEINSGLTLGQIVDRLHKKIGEIFNQPKQPAKNIDPVYSLINRINEGSTNKDIQNTLRELAHYIKDLQNNLEKKIDDINKVDSRCSPFPSQIYDNLNEILRWRNAASHNSRVPPGSHEADRTIYCLVRLITWWQNNLHKLDWSQSKRDLLETLIKAAK